MPWHAMLAASIPKGQNGCSSCCSTCFHVSWTSPSASSFPRLDQAEYLFNQHFNQGRSHSVLSKVCTVAVMAASIALLISASQIARASDNPALDADILSVAEEWAKVKYLSETDGERKEKMAPVGAKADELVKRYPGRVEALIWDGIVTSDRASLTWGLTALNLATRARDLLLEAEK